jgi:hypothetical protein
VGSWQGDLEVCSVAAEGVMKLLFHQHMAKSAEQHALQVRMLLCACNYFLQQ